MWEIWLRICCFLCAHWLYVAVPQTTQMSYISIHPSETLESINLVLTDAALETSGVAEEVANHGDLWTTVVPSETIQCG